jgi:hypothetical protein
MWSRRRPHGKGVSDNYRSANPALEPTVTLIVNAGSLEFTVDYVVDYTKRSAMKDQLFTTIVEEVANSDRRIEWASSGITVINQSDTQDAIKGHPSSSSQRAGRAADSH